MNPSVRNTVLFVDDEELNLFLFEKTFERDFIVKTASSGIQGLKVLEEDGSTVKVVISDMRMPNMNGLEFVERAKKSFPEVEYFILTGYGYTEELQEALKSRLISHLFHKPFEYKKIKEAIGL